MYVLLLLFFLNSPSWSRERAIQFMLTYTSETRTAVEREVDRYITWPGQALGYKIGEIKILGLRKKAESKLGTDSFKTE